MPDIKPELIEKAAKAAYCESIVPKYREHMWSIADIGTTEAYYREARAALEAVADELRAEGAAKALRDAADDIDREAAEDEASYLVANVRCPRCNLRYEERQEYSCLVDGWAHEYDEDELAGAAVVRVEVEPTYDGDQLRARADRIEARDE